MSPIEKVVSIILIHPKARSAVKYLSQHKVVKATRRGKFDGRDRHEEVLLSVGRPNYAEREFIKKCLKSGEPFPVKKIQVKFEA